MALLIQPFAVPGLIGGPSLRANTHSVSRACERWTSRPRPSPRPRSPWSREVPRERRRARGAADDAYEHLVTSTTAISSARRRPPDAAPAKLAAAIRAAATERWC